MKTYHYTFFDVDHIIGFCYGRYLNNNLYVGMLNIGNPDDPYFADLTINTIILKPFFAAIDNQFDENICYWLESIGAGKNCHSRVYINFASYPLFEFDPQFLEEANPKSFITVFNKK